MKKSDRIVVFFIGVLLGTLLVSMILTRRAMKAESAADPWVSSEAAALEQGFEPLPGSVPESIRKGRIIDFGYLPEKAEALEKVWHLHFDASYPYVRVVENLESGEINIMAADQILIQLAEGVDVTELKPMLDALGLRLRMFNRAEQLAVVGVLSTCLDAVPETLNAVEAYEALFDSAKPDRILFKKSPE